jgi:hypothetical protein
MTMMRTRTISRTISILVLVMLVIAALAGYVLISASKENTSGSFPANSETTNSTLGLQLELSIENDTVVSPGKIIVVNITLFNLMKTDNGLSQSLMWPVFTIQTVPCNVLYPLRLGVVSGYYDLNNLSRVTESQIVNFTNPDLAYHCPIVPVIRYWYFQSQSDLADICSGTLVGTGCYKPMSQLVEIDGTWSSNSTIPGRAICHELTPGVYTIIGGDEWGQIVVLHFRVRVSN